MASTPQPFDPADVYARLFRAYGPQGWWPADSPLEVMVGAVLVQNTAWLGVERAIANLVAADALDAARIVAMPDDALGELIRPAGTFRVKTQRLKALMGLVVERYGGSLDALFAQDAGSLRAELLAVHGVGPETADSIVLYAAGLPSFVIDAYTRRVLERHGWAAGRAKYAELQALLSASLPAEAPLYNEYHALLVRVAKEHCRTRPRCAGCPLEPLLPPGGPLPPLAGK